MPETLIRQLDLASSLGADTGSNDDYAINLSPAIPRYFNGLVIYFKAHTTNIGAATLNVNSLGAKTIKKQGATDLVDGDIVSGQIVTVIYDGTNFQLQSGNPGNGPQGPQGNQGAAGAQGNQGNQGYQGLRGYQGYQGDSGAQGATGAQGNQGNQGASGAQGAAGAQGNQGNQGAAGAQGNAGAQGAAGAQGNQGNQGAAGPQGAAGAQGDQGVRGYQGYQGYQGSTGTTGAQGASGAQGATGSQGPQGSTGAQGSQGNQGNQGNQGAQGAGANLTWNEPLAYDEETNEVSLEYNPADLEVSGGVLQLYRLPTVSLSGGSSVEIGSTVSSVSLSWTCSKTMATRTLSSPVPVGDRDRGSGQNGSYTHSGANLTSNTTYTITVGDGTNTANSSTTVGFYYRRYWGTSASTTLNSSQINVLSSELSSSRSKSWSQNGNGQYIYYCYPASWGLATFTIGGLTNTDFTLSVQSHTNASGATTNYNVYRTNSTTDGTGIAFAVT